MKKVLKVLGIFVICSSNLYSNSNFWTLVSFNNDNVVSYLTSKPMMAHGESRANKFLLEAEKGACLLGSHNKVYDDLFSNNSIFEYRNNNFIFKADRNLGPVINKADYLKYNISSPQSRKIAVELINNNIFIRILEEENCKQFEFKNEESIDDHPGAKVEFIYKCSDFETSNTERTYTLKTCSKDQKTKFEYFLSDKLAIPVKLNF